MVKKVLRRFGYPRTSRKGHANRPAAGRIAMRGMGRISMFKPLAQNVTPSCSSPFNQSGHDGPMPVCKQDISPRHGTQFPQRAQVQKNTASSRHCHLWPNRFCIILLLGPLFDSGTKSLVQPHPFRPRPDYIHAPAATLRNPVPPAPRWIHANYRGLVDYRT